jgi:hypothetical protein
MNEKMKGCIKKRIISVWLLAILAMPLAVQFLHVCQMKKYSEHEECTGHGNTHHDCKTCVICQFVLPTFVETELIGAISILEAIPFKQTFSYSEEINNNAFSSYYLRGPPVTCA